MPEMTNFLQDYVTAQSFRFGHFFICYLSLGAAILGGFPTNLKVTEWTKVEWPRSMSDVVNMWNLPMHHFLHKCNFRFSGTDKTFLDIFAKTRQFGYLMAMMLAFLSSSLLHVRFTLTWLNYFLGF